jgi:hypothetical protein
MKTNISHQESIAKVHLKRTKGSIKAGNIVSPFISLGEMQNLEFKSFIFLKSEINKLSIQGHVTL